MHAAPQFGALPPGESGGRFKWSVTGSRWCNGAALPWFLVSRRSANWGLSGFPEEKHLRLLCGRQSHDREEEQTLPFVRIRRQQESAFRNNHRRLDARKKKKKKKKKHAQD